MHNKLLQTQSLNITKSLAQSINLMQMSTLELGNFINQEIEQNPLLEESDEDDAYNYDIYHSSLDISDHEIASRVNLKDHLLEQIFLDLSSDEEKRISQILIDYLNEDGYLCNFSLSDLGSLPDSFDIEALLSKLRMLDPVGVFSRNLQENLAAQLVDLGKFSDDFAILLKNLDLVATNQVTKLARIISKTNSEILDMIKLVKNLNPRPAKDFSANEIAIRTPDVIISKRYGDYYIELPFGHANKVKINKDYITDLRLKVKNKAEKKYLSEQYNNAKNLIKSIEQRNKTLLKVAESILRKQINFFEQGVMSLVPMTLQDVANDVNMHESTISRITTNKYILTPRGLFDFKYFFTSKICNNLGNEISSTKIKEIIKAIIDSEPNNKSYSDIELSEQLEKLNFKAARRTVAKYREEMNIPTSALRAKKKKLFL